MLKTETAIIKEILAGNKRAYGDLVDRHKDKAMTLAIRMLRNREDAEEAIQDAFVRAFNALPRFEWKSSFSTWFYRIVYNVCASKLSRRGEDPHITIDAGDDEGALELASDEAPPDIQYESIEFEQIVLGEIEKLPLLYSAVCTLFFVHDMSYDQIVEVTGMPLGTVKVRLFRGRVMLRDGVVRKFSGSNVKAASIQEKEQNT
ncbi:MAG: sigma-70 family RNA polymerase sigma factor [Ignavibacteriales bacterium]|nr:sigma-70 family RNA polymerase sigma factor [Ignavibacteriales bacterium]